MKIDRQLNLVVEIPREGDPDVIAHSVGLPTDIVEQYHYLAGPTMNALVTRGYGYFAPRYSASVLREVAQEQACAVSTEQRVQEAAQARAKQRVDAFFSEIRRRTHVLSLTDSGWEHVPIADAMKAETIDDEESSQIENAIVFFTFGLRSWTKAQRGMVTVGLSLCGAQTSSLSCMELMRSLPTSMKVDSSGETPGASQKSLDGSQGPDSKITAAASTSPGPAIPRIAIGS